MKRFRWSESILFAGASLSLLFVTGCASSSSAISPHSADLTNKAPLNLARKFPPDQSPQPLKKAIPAVEAPQSPFPITQENQSLPVLFVKVPDDPSIQLYLDYFQYADHLRFKKWLERSQEYLPYMQKTFHEMGLPEDLAYLSMIESGFNTHAYSRTGAAGLWQFMRGTGKKYGLMINWWIDQRRDPVLATRSAAQYLKDLHDEFNSWELALAAYNAGEGRVANAVARVGTKDYWKIRQTRAFSSETRNYIPKMIAAMMIAKDPVKYGFTDLEYRPQLIVRQESIHQSFEVHSLARAMNMPVSEFLALNPQFIRWATPPRASSISINVPVALGESFTKNLSSLPVTKLNSDAPTYRVHSGDSLWSLSRRFHVPVTRLVAANQLSSHRLSLHQKLIIPHGNSSNYSLTGKPRYSRHHSLHTAGWIDHRIRRGDSLYFLAHHYRTSVKEILARNHLHSSKILRVGDHIMIPSR